MELITYTQKRGRQAELARAIGVRDSVICDWKKGRFPIPEKRCYAIEKATGGAVTRKDLRPHDWHEIWPELIEGNQCTLRSQK